ncbi:MAG: hypothetical protein RLY86_1488 [Pseudomonadota bacterium]|jgi:uncharacterized membrane protein
MQHHFTLPTGSLPCDRAAFPSPSPTWSPSSPPCDEPPDFDVLITPPVPMGARAHRVVVGVFLAVAVATACLFALSAAWPLTPLPLASWAVLLAALTGHRRASCRWERVRLWPGLLHLTWGDATDAMGRQESLSLFGSTLRSTVDVTGAVRRIELRCRDRAQELGALLTPDERTAFRDALLTALHAAGHRPRLEEIRL